MTLRSFAPKSTALFAGGGSEPYARLLSSGRDGSFTLRRLSGAHGEAEPRELWHASDLRGPATRADLSALDEVRGPLLDVGCGPGRMVRAAAGMAMPALGIDIYQATGILMASALGLIAATRLEMFLRARRLLAEARAA